MEHGSPGLLAGNLPGAGQPLGRGLVLHADDLGLNEKVTAGILRGFSHGLLTSTAMLTNAPGCQAAVGQWKELQASLLRRDLPSCDARRSLADPLTPFDLGVHLNLTQGRPLTGERFPGQLLDRDGCFCGVYGLARRLVISRPDLRSGIERELRAQIDVLVDRGLRPTHLNAHQYVDLLPSVGSVIPQLLRRYSIRTVRVPWERRLTRTTLIERFEPANWCLAQVKRLLAFRHLVVMRRHRIASPSSFHGTSHAGRIDLALMRSFIAAAGPGVTEIGMHPGAAADARAGDCDGGNCGRATAGWDDPLAALRNAELSLLTSAELVRLLQDCQLGLARLGDLSSSRAARAAA